MGPFQLRQQQTQVSAQFLPAQPSFKGSGPPQSALAQAFNISHIGMILVALSAGNILQFHLDKWEEKETLFLDADTMGRDGAWSGQQLHLSLEGKKNSFPAIQYVPALAHHFRKS